MNVGMPVERKAWAIKKNFMKIAVREFVRVSYAIPMHVLWIMLH